MAGMTAQQRTDFRNDIGDTNSAFSDDELDRIYDRVADAANDNLRWRASKALAFEQLLNSANKLHDYTAGAVGEKLSQVWDHLNKRYNDYKPALDEVYGVSSGMARLHLRRFPVDRKDPTDWSTD